ncbi:selenocysteine insertion sequence-binding protein 2 [Trichonephila clavata]|uniref:Selenocysteine insertion sequence-binding protein 2 n=1 Tax=Trichonephila clavata TaxID=2740835 RepID=A0A8X6LBW4_TRICU|nr:selenocysteine insertion sequence-binding protein 2 [Trichonephila clavata]
MKNFGLIKRLLISQFESTILVSSVQQVTNLEMNKGKKSQGAIKTPNHKNQFIQQHQNHLASDNKHVFKADSHDFPSLSEAFEGNKKQEKKSLKYGYSDFTYSAKLKIQPQEKISQNIPLENLSQNESVCFKSKASINNRANNNACTLKSSQATHSVSLGSKRQQSLPVDNKLSSSNKNLSHPLRDSGISKEKTGKSGLVSQNSDLFWKQKNRSDYKNNPNTCLNENNPLTQKCVSTQKKSNTAHGEPSTSLKKEQSFNKIHKDNFVSRSSVQNPIVSNGSDISNWRSNVNHVSSAKSERSCNKSDEWIIIEKKSKHSELNKFGNSTPISYKNIGQSCQNITQPSTKGSNVSTIKTQKAPLNPKLSSSSENKVKSQTSSTQQTSGVTVKVKKKRKRDSKLKRQAALQSGKLLVLTPEVHSKIINQSNNVNVQKYKNVVVNINDSEEYPELGSSESKNNKEVSVKVPVICSKTEIPANSITDAFETNKFEAESTISKEVSETNNVHEASKLDAKGSGENMEEVKVVRSNNPITLSLFDMLLTAKPKKKESERKDESQGKIAKVTKKETTRKAVNLLHPLNSSRPIVKRGKEREFPKMKRPSRLRKLILLGRQQKRESMIIKNHERENSLSDECSLSPEKSVEIDENKLENLISEVDYSCAINKNENEEILSKDLNNCKKDLVFCLKEENENLVQNFTACDEENQKNMQTGPTKQGMNVLELSAKPTAVLKGSENSDIDNTFLESNLCLINAHEVEELGTVCKTCDESGYKSSEEFLIHHSIPDVPFAEKEVRNHLSECTFNSKLIDLENHVDNIHSEKGIDCIEYKDDDCANDIQCNKSLISNVMKTFADPNWLHEKQNSPLNNLAEASNITIEAVSEKKSNVFFTADYNLIENKMETISITENTGCMYNLISDVLTSGDQTINDTSNKSSANNTCTIDCNLDNGKKKEDQSDTMKTDSHAENISHVSENQYSDQERLQAIKLLFHSRKFRQYCNHFISRQIDETVFALIDDLARFQDRMHQKDPVKAKIKRRLVYGIKEIKKHMQLKKIKCIIMATDIEDIKIEGGLNDIIEELKFLAEVYHIPYIFSHRRFNLGKICRKSVPVSCVGIFNYEGSEKNFKKLVELYEDSKYDYSLLTENLASELTSDQIKELFEAEKEPLLLHEASQRILREILYSSPEGFPNSTISDSIKNGESCSINTNLMPYSQLADDNFTDVETCISFPSKKCRNPEENSDALLNKKANIILRKYNVVKE